MRTRSWLTRAVRRLRAVAPDARASFQSGVENTLRIGDPLTLAYLNIERFRGIVRLHGAERADQILSMLGKRFAAAFGAAAVVRLPGDEFLLQFRGESRDADVSLALRELARLVALPIAVGAGRVSLSAAVGTASAPSDGDCFQQLFDHAERAMLDARRADDAARRRNAPPAQAAGADDAIRDALRAALERKEFVLHYQPQVDLASGAVVGAEALIRWDHPMRGLLAPGHFIGAAERTGMIVPIGRWAV